MAEFKADVWRRRVSTIPLIGRTVTKDQVSVEASNVQSALDQILRVERLEYPPSRFRVYVQIETGQGPQGLGDADLIDHVSEQTPITPER